jgi:fibronectin type 3 domain-containing protein
MKKLGLVLFSVLLALLLAACPSGGGGNGDEDDDDIDELVATTITFQNNERYEVGVSASPGGDPLWRVPGNSTSTKIEYAAGTGNFYLTYYINIDSTIFPYSPAGAKGFLYKEIVANTDTVFIIPQLSSTHTAAEMASSLTQGVYFKIDNSSETTFSMQQGDSVLLTMNGKTALASGESDIYLLSEGASSRYNMSWNVIGNIPFPEEMTNLEAGYFYSCSFQSGIVFALEDSYSISLANLAEENIPEGSAPAAPSAPTVQAGNASLAVSWTAVSDATSYQVFYHTSNNSAEAAQYGNDISGTLTVTISELNNGTSYYVWIKAKNSYGSSGFSPSASGTPSAGNTNPEDPEDPEDPEEPEPLAAPANLRVLSKTVGSITLAWNSVAKASGYKVLRAGTADGTYNQLGTSSSTAYNDTGLVANTTYHYRVLAYNTTGDGSYSAISATTDADSGGTIPLPPAAPTGLVVDSVSSTSISFSWNTVGAASSYNIYRANTATATSAKIGTATSGSYTDTTMPADRAFYYTVKAVNNSGESPASNTAFAISASHYSLPGLAEVTTMSISSGETHHYRLAVTKNQSYTICWDNGEDENTNRVYVSVWQNNGTVIHGGNTTWGDGSGYTDPLVFSANSDGFVTIELGTGSGYTVSNYSYRIYHY